jgi:predicted ABC-class ATPase
LAIGGSGDYFDVADRVICMVEYKPYDLSRQAHTIAQKHRAGRSPEGGQYFGRVTERIPVAQSFDPSKGRREVKISSKGLQSIVFGSQTIDLGAVEQLVDISQTKAIGDAIYYATKYMDERRTLGQIVSTVLRATAEKGLDVLSHRPAGDYAAFRGMEFAAAINRLRTLSVRKKG